MISFSRPGGGVSNDWDFDYTGPDSTSCTGNIQNGPAVANYTATGITASTTYSIPGTYIVVYRRQEFGPPFTSHWCTQVTVTTTTSLNGYIDEKNVSIYPNNGAFTLEISGKQLQDVEIQIINTLGQEIFFEKQKQIDGTYKE